MGVPTIGYGLPMLFTFFYKVGVPTIGYGLPMNGYGKFLSAYFCIVLGVLIGDLVLSFLLELGLECYFYINRGCGLLFWIFNSFLFDNLF